MGKLLKALKTFFLLSSLVSIGFLFMNRQILAGLTGALTSPPASPTAANGTAPAPPNPVTLASVISAAAPNNSKAQLAAGALYLRENKIEEALKAFQNAVDADPKNAGAHFQVGMILMKHEKLVEAEKEFRAAIQLDPENTDARFGLAAVIQQTGNSEDAIALYKEISRLKPLNAEAHNNLGIIYDSQGSKEKALMEFKQAQDLAPNDELIRQNFEDTLRETQEVARVDSAPSRTLQEISAQNTVPVDSPTENDKPIIAPTFNATHTLVLQNGRKAEGNLAEKTSSGVWLEVESGRVFFSNEEILEIQPAS